MREMRRKDRQLTEAAAWEILHAAEYGVLSTVGEDSAPYGVPLSYVVVDKAIYFHCAKSGQKLDNIAHQPSVSFCAVGKTQPLYDGDFTTLFESAIASGPCTAVEDAAEKHKALEALCLKYSPEHADKIAAAIQQAGAITAVFRINVAHITGKAKQPKP